MKTYCYICVIVFAICSSAWGEEDLTGTHLCCTPSIEQNLPFYFSFKKNFIELRSINYTTPPFHIEIERDFISNFWTNRDYIFYGRARINRKNLKWEVNYDGEWYKNGECRLISTEEARDRELYERQKKLLKQDRQGRIGNQF
jgi:hypothetical protein